MRKVRILDTTLRDGEQAPGFAMLKEQKIFLAKKLEELGVDCIEAGFPISSPQAFESVSAIAELCRNVEIGALARCSKQDIDSAILALKKAAFPRIQLFIGTSDIHMIHQLKLSKNQVLESARLAVKQTKQFTSKITFAAEDATRSNREFLKQVLEAVIEEGCDIVNIPDTVGYMIPTEYADLIAYLKTHVKGIDNVIISTHCHDDLGLSVANSLAGVFEGAGQIDCTVNGIGERAGNAALEEIVMALKMKSDIYKAYTGIHIEKLVPISRALSDITGYNCPPNKAIVGKNAFAHGSGIHQQGVISHPNTYEIMDPQDVGTQTEIVLTKHSGKAALQYRLKQLGIDVGDQIENLFIAFKSLADQKKCVSEDDLKGLVSGKLNIPTPLMPFAYKDRKIIPEDQAKVSIASHSLQYGSTVFSGIRGYFRNDKVRVFRLKDHHERMMNASKIMKFEYSMPYNEFEQIIGETIRMNRPVTDFYIRPFIYSENKIIGIGHKNLTFNMAIYMVPLESYYPRDKSLKLQISSWQKIGDAAISTKAKVGGSYANASLARDDAKTAGFDDALLMDQHQNIVEATGANLFIVYRNEIYTSALGFDSLEGITMRSIIELLKERRYTIHRESISRSMIYSADEVFITGTAAGIVPIESVDGRLIGDGTEGPVTKTMKTDFQNIIQMAHPKSKEWLTEF